MRYGGWVICVAAVFGLSIARAHAQPQNTELPTDVPRKELPPPTGDSFRDSIFQPGMKTPGEPLVSPQGTFHDATTANDRLPLPSTTCSQVAACGCGSEFATWLTAEWVIGTTRGPSLVPIITTGPASAGLLAGSIGQPTTLPLFGGRPVLNDWRSGLRLEAGVWFDNDHRLGISARVYSLFSTNEEFATRATNTAVINVPQFSGGANSTQTPLFVSFPGIAAGSVTARTRTTFTSGDINFRLLLDRGENSRIELLAGYRQLHLGDDLGMSFDSTRTFIPQVPIVAVHSVGGDSINTTDNFYGPQIGLYGSTRWNRLTLEGHVASAMGVTASELDFVHGRNVTTSMLNNPLGNPTVTTLLANPPALIALGVPPATVAALLPTTRTLVTNLANMPANQANTIRSGISNTVTYLGVVAEGGLRVNWRATDHVRLTAGYNFLYWNNVRRAQEMFVNSPILRTPAADFTTHVVSAGLDFRY